MIYFKRTPSGLRTATQQYVRPHRHHAYRLAVAVCEAHTRRPVVQLKDLVISPIYSPKLTLPARQGRRVVLWAGSGLDGYEHGFQYQFECRPPHFVRQVGTASLKPGSSYLPSAG